VQKIGKNYWKFGDKWAGVDNSGNRFVTDTKRKARSKAGSRSAGKRSNKSKGGRSMSRNVKLLPLIGAAGGSADAIGSALNGKYDQAKDEITRNWTGYNPSRKEFEFRKMTGLAGLLVGAAGSKLMSKLGINQMLPKGINL